MKRIFAVAVTLLVLALPYQGYAQSDDEGGQSQDSSYFSEEESAETYPSGDDSDAQPSGQDTQTYDGEGE